jgi:hypothetical protein
MKIYGMPAELEATIPNFMDLDWKAYDAAIEAHQQTVIAWLRDNGYPGKNTGRIFRTPRADGYANYMVAEGRSTWLMHLPYGDAWHDPDVQFLPKKEILARIDRADRVKSMFAAKAHKA